MKELLKKVLPEGKFWTKAWSLVEGCTPVSPGCANCWLAGMQNRNLPNMTKGLLNPGSKHFNGLIKCHEERLDDPIRARKPRVYAIWSDLFHEKVDYWFRRQAFNRMSASERHHFIIVTKRPHVAVDFLRGLIGRDDRHLGFQKWPLSNVTILVSVEDQQRANERVPYALQLAEMGWRVGALCEPLLGPIDFSEDRYGDGERYSRLASHYWNEAAKAVEKRGPSFSWLITGGESGHGARPVHPDWVRSLRDQAQVAGVPFMFKQWGEWGLCWYEDPDGKPMEPRQTNEWMERVGKKKAGRTLDGREWLEVMS